MPPQHATLILGIASIYQWCMGFLPDNIYLLNTTIGLSQPSVYISCNHKINVEHAVLFEAIAADTTVLPQAT